MIMNKTYKGKGIAMWNTVINAIRMLLIVTIITGVIYPLAMTGIAQLLFTSQANGSMLVQDGKIVGSRLIGQNFSNPGYFHGRPSAAGADGYDGISSAGSNLGPTSQKLKDTVLERISNERQQNNLAEGANVPSDLVLASASGLDPHITPDAAYVQVQRVAQVREINPNQVRSLISEHVEGKQIGFLGEARVNVLELNLALDAVKP